MYKFKQSPVPEKVLRTYIIERSELAQEIVSHKPNFVEKWGLLIFLGILILTLISTWFIQYADIIQTTATLSAINAPKEMVCRQEGKVESLFVSNEDSIIRGQTIAWIESTANHGEVETLSQSIDKGIEFLKLKQLENVSKIFSTELHDLGDIQPSYQRFVTAWQQFNDYLINGFFVERKKMLLRDLSFLIQMHHALLQEEELNKEDLELTKEAFNANKSLYEDKVISKQEYRDHRSKLVLKQMSLPQQETQLLLNKGQQIAKQKEIDEINHTIDQQTAVFRQELETLKSIVDEWKKKYVIVSPTDGRIVFVMPLQKNQHLSSGRVIALINPPDSKFYVQVNLPQSNFGKLEIGQNVQLRFDAYPYEEFGFVNGRLSYISAVSSDSGFLASIDLPTGLRTSYKKELQYRSGLRAKALIITRKTRLLQRFYLKFKKVLSEK